PKTLRVGIASSFQQQRHLLRPVHLGLVQAPHRAKAVLVETFEVGAHQACRYVCATDHRVPSPNSDRHCTRDGDVETGIPKQARGWPKQHAVSSIYPCFPTRETQPLPRENRLPLSEPSSESKGDVT